MADKIENGDYKTKHVDESVAPSQFLDASRSVIYAQTIKKDGTLTPFRAIGLVQSYGWSEQKDIQQIYEIGSDVPYMVPGRTRGGISISRVLLSGKDFINAIYHGDQAIVPVADFIKSLAHIDTPINLMFVAIGGSTSAPLVYSRIFSDCHITARQESIGAGQTIIMESVSITYSYVSDASIEQQGGTVV